MKYMHKIVSVLTLLMLLTLTFVTPARAFDGRSGDNVVIAAGEVINDDLYVTAENFTLDGTVNGDVVVVGRTVTINGTVDGDLTAAAQVVVINGSVTDDVRAAGEALQFGESAQVGGDVVVAGASLETKRGSTVGGELVVGSGQALLAGDVTGDVMAGTGGLELRGSFGGDVHAFVDATADSASEPPMNIYMMQVPISIQPIKPGLIIADTARIAGDLEYSSTVDLPIPSGAVAGKVTRVEPAVHEGRVVRAPTQGELVGHWALDVLRSAATLILLGLLLGWLFPRFIQALPEKLRSQPLPSLGWGAVAWAAFCFTLLAIVVATVLSAILFGVLTLGGLSGAVIVIGILLFFALIVSFALTVAYLSKVIVGETLGKWILGRSNPAMADHKVWPLVVGVLVLVLVIGILTFPLLPLGFFGWLVKFAVELLGLGALWLWGREAWRTRKTA
ncbi:MAG TPA: polymer-forming cytoskeletal protein [Anaerolineales bacterium]